MIPLGKQAGCLGAQQGTLSTRQKIKILADLATKAAKKIWDEERTKIELQIHELMPHYGLFVEKQYFENDEVYQIYPMYALFKVKERLSPWYYQAWSVRDWAKINRHVIVAYIQLQHQLYSQRGSDEHFRRMARD